MGELIETDVSACIACGKVCEQADPSDGHRHVPHGGLLFDAGPGHYGSTVWDVMVTGVSLQIVVCDECLLERRARVRRVEYVRVAPRRHAEVWVADEGGPF